MMINRPNRPPAIRTDASPGSQRSETPHSARSYTWGNSSLIPIQNEPRELAERSIRYRGEFDNFQEYVFYAIKEIASGALNALSTIWRQLKDIGTHFYHRFLSSEEATQQPESDTGLTKQEEADSEFGVEVEIP